MKELLFPSSNLDDLVCDVMYFQKRRENFAIIVEGEQAHRIYYKEIPSRRRFNEAYDKNRSAKRWRAWPIRIWFAVWYGLPYALTSRTSIFWLSFGIAVRDTVRHEFIYENNILRVEFYY